MANRKTLRVQLAALKHFYPKLDGATAENLSFLKTQLRGLRKMTETYLENIDLAIVSCDKVMVVEEKDIYEAMDLRAEMERDEWS